MTSKGTKREMRRMALAEAILSRSGVLKPPHRRVERIPKRNGG